MVTTEFGKMEVKPNEICIIQVNICCKQITLDCCSVIKVVSTGQCLPRFGNAHFVFEEGRSKLVKRKKLAKLLFIYTVNIKGLCHMAEPLFSIDV